MRMTFPGISRRPVTCRLARRPAPTIADQTRGLSRSETGRGSEKSGLHAYRRWMVEMIKCSHEKHHVPVRLVAELLDIPSKGFDILSGFKKVIAERVIANKLHRYAQALSKTHRGAFFAGGPRRPTAVLPNRPSPQHFPRRFLCPHLHPWCPAVCFRPSALCPEPALPQRPGNPAELG